MSAPLAVGSVSLRLYPPALDDPTRVLDELIGQAVLADRYGFDGVMLSERHGGAWGQIPNPLQAAGWLLAAMHSGWVAPCPILLPFRQPAVVAEELAWLAARFPGRVAAGFGSGGNESDFAAMGVPFDERAVRFDIALRAVVEILRPGPTPSRLGGDRAIARVRERGLPLLSAVMSAAAARRAAQLGLGLIGSSLLDDTSTRRHVDVFHASGGTGPHVVIVRVWLGDPPWQLIGRQLAEYRHAPDATTTATAGADTDTLLHDTDPAALATRLVERLRATKADAVNVRVHVAGLDPVVARDQLTLIGTEVVPIVRRTWQPSRVPPT